MALLLFLALASLYYYKERERIFQEEKTKNYLVFAECKKLHKLIPSTAPCQMPSIVLAHQLTPIYKELLIAFVITLLLITPFGIYLSLLSLRPIRESIHTMDSFINGIVHDINTPLSIISINAQSLMKKLEGEEKLLAKSHRILQGVEHIEALEEQLLFMMRIHHYTLQKSTFDLYALLTQRLDYYRDLSQSHTFILEGSTMIVSADKDALTRMIDNLVINAVKYSSKTSSITLTCQNNTFSVKDEGIGIKNPKEVFNKYYRESTQVKGLGLGLYVVHEIAKMHTIAINITSELNKGTMFRLHLNALLTSNVSNEKNNSL